MTLRRWLLLALAAAAVLLLGARALAEIYVDHAWFAAVGATDLWRVRAITIAALRVGSSAVSTLLVFANLYAVRRSVVSLVFPRRRVGNLEIDEEVPARYLTLAVVAVSVLLGVSLALPQDDWSTALVARSNVPFGDSDPYFATDLGFFVYWLPFETEIFSWLLMSTIVVTVVVVCLYALTPSLRWHRGGLHASAYVRRHVTVLAGVLLLLLAWSFRLDMYSLLMQGSGPDGAFTAVDRTVGIPGNLVLALITLCAAILVVWSGWTGQLRLAGTAILGVLVLSMIVRELAPFLARRSDDDQAAADARVYENTRAGYTRRAFGVSRIVRADTGGGYPSVGALDRQVAVWDAPAIAAAAGDPRSSDAVGLPVGWRAGDEGMVADLPLPPRTTSTETLPAWDLERALASAADARGAIVPARAGAQTPLRVLVSPVGGREPLIISDPASRAAAIPLQSAVARVAYAFAYQEPRWLFSRPALAHPALLTHRDVRERVALLAPFFAQGSSVAPALLGDSLYWTLELYSASGWYPLSRRVHIADDEQGYFQHAATAIVDAATGETFVVADSVLDPIATTWTRRLPSLFTTWSSLPAGLADALPPLRDALYADAIAFGRYGTRSESDVPRHVPTTDGADAPLADLDPAFVAPPAIARDRTSAAVGEVGRSISFSVPLLDAADRVRGLLVARGGAHRTISWSPIALPGERWPTVVQRLKAADTTRAPAGMALVRGPIRAVPVGSDVAFVQPTFLWPSAAAPTLAGVAILLRDSVRVGPTLAAAAGVYSGGAPPGPAGDSRARAAALYEAMRDALRGGDWVAFGHAFDALGRLLGRSGPATKP